MSIEYPCVYHKNGWCHFDKSQPDACVFGPCENETPSNGDKIREMSDEEILKLLNQVYSTGSRGADKKELFTWDIDWLCAPAQDASLRAAAERKTHGKENEN